MRNAGILMHLTSLPSPYGIGTMGAQAREFVDFLHRAGQSVWQTLPVCPTSFGDSPYQTFSTFAENPYLIDLDLLREDGLLQKGEYEDLPWGSDPAQVDYGAIYQLRFPVLRKAFARFKEHLPADYDLFCWDQGDWLEDYALFMALKEAHGGAPWYQWEDGLKHRWPEDIALAKLKYGDDIYFWKMLQYLFAKQWNELKAYANERGIAMFGDLPIYVAMDSADVWTHPERFELNERLEPIEVAGCPPDGFTADGQLWGNPLYRWDVMEAEGYDWWVRRVGHAFTLFDKVRIDHFRGFESYYAVPGGDKTAKNGRWRPGPGLSFFRTLEARLGKLDIVAEDLGYLTEAVHQLVDASGYPGMKLLQFAFDSRENSDYLPHRYGYHCVVYTGTHDNDTILGWMNTAPKADTEFARKYLRLTEEEGVNWGMMKSAWATVGDLAIVTMQDLLGLGSEARMNIPSTATGNWRWRMLPGQATDALADTIYENMELYRRLVV